MGMSTDTTTLELFERVQQGDPQAATELFDNYVERLLRLAHSRISKQLARRVDADDVVQSVFRTFFQRAKNGRFTLAKSGDLWRLLAAITVNKVNGQAKHHGAQKRDFRTETSDATSESLMGLSAEAVAADPSPLEAAALEEELRRAFEQLPDDQQQIARQWMEGDSMAEIAEANVCSERKVYRVRDRFREILHQRLAQHSSG